MHDNPEDPQVTGSTESLSRIWAGRRRRFARASGASDMLPVSQNAFSGAYYLHQLARIYTMVGEPDKAIDQLEELLKVPVLRFPGLAQDRPDVRSAAEEPAIPEAGGRAGTQK